MQPISTLIVDDERLARSRLRRLLNPDPEIEIAGECANGLEAVDFLRRHTPGLVFLDVQMPGMDGFEVLQKAKSEPLPVVVFVTAYDHYALRAFEVHAFDYLLKPFDRRRFHQTLARAKTQVKLLRQKDWDQRIGGLLDNLDTERRDLNRIAIRAGGYIHLLDAGSIDWVEAADNYIKFHCGSEIHVSRETMASIEKRLDPSRFIRIHRSTIVNADRVKEIQPSRFGDYQVVLRDGAVLALSRAIRNRLRARLVNGG